MTSVPLDVPEQSSPDPNEVIRVTVRALRSAHQVDAVELARHLGISRQSLYNRLNGHAPWLASEVAALADFFGCEVQDLYSGTVHIGGPPFTRGTTSPVTPRITRVCSADQSAQMITFPQVRRRKRDRRSSRLGDRRGPAARVTFVRAA